MGLASPTATSVAYMPPVRVMMRGTFEQHRVSHSLIRSGDGFVLRRMSFAGVVGCWWMALSVELGRACRGYLESTIRL